MGALPWYCVRGHTPLRRSFDSATTLVQLLTEAARRSKRSMVVASLPESNMEIGGEAGQTALARLEPTFGRVEAVWKPVGALEGFEIVRRPCAEPGAAV